MSIFKRKRNLVINNTDPTYKVKYLGNVQTAMMKGDGCVDKPIAIIWNNHLRNPSPGLDMRLTFTSSGLKAFTKEQGLTEYRAHRISYCVAHPAYPKLFVWVYRHEGKKMKMELRCHAVLCKTDAKAKAMALQLHQKITSALKEFMREKTRKQNARLTLLRTNSLPIDGSVGPKRRDMLSTGKNFKPSICKSNTAPKLGAIDEGIEHEHEEDLIEEEDEDETELLELARGEDNHVFNALTLCGHDVVDGYAERSVIDLEVGNNIDELKLDSDVQFCLNSAGDSDDESSESGFHEQDKEGSLTAADDTSLDGEEPVCDITSGHVEQESAVTSL